MSTHRRLYGWILVFALLSVLTGAATANERRDPAEPRNVDLLTADPAAEAVDSPMDYRALAGPAIDVWYGHRQTFRKVGTPQRWVNILGNVSTAAGLNGLSYTLNGGASISLSWGPDTRRLQADGDFNIDLLLSTLKVLPDSNRVVIAAEDGQSVVGRDTVIVRIATGTSWPATYAVRWSGATSLADSVQVVDGYWGLDGNAVRVQQPGYDRVIALGDTTWQNYEVTVPITVHALDQAGYNPVSAYPSVGILMRWAGHTNDPEFSPPIDQPFSGYNPLGAIGYYSWRGVDDERLEIFGNGAVRVAEDYPGKKLTIGAEYVFKMRVRNTALGPFYSLKMWPSAEAEPVAWDLSYQAHTTDPQRGSFMLVAHHVDASFGAVTVAPVAADITPPTISTVRAAAGKTSVTVSWTTNEPATSVLEYGLTTSYGGTAASTALVTDHRLTLLGLPETTTFHYRVTSIDGGANGNTSGDGTFTTKADPTIITDEFNAPGLNTNLWTVRDAFGDGTVSMTGSRLSLQIPAGMPHDAWTGANNTLHLLQPAVDADFDLEVKIDGPMTAEFQLSGILVKQDEQNYLRFDFNSDGLNTRIFAATILNNLATGITGFNDVVAPNGAVPLYMRVSRERNLFRLFYSLDGTTWSQETEFTADIVVSAVGIFAGSSGSTPPAHTALFDYFHASLPAAPQALRPANGAGDQATDLTLAWKRYAPGTTYHLQLSADSTFAGTMVINDSTLTDTTQAVSGLQLGLPYYWRLRGKLGSVATGFSSRWQFTTVVGPPSSPALLAPANGVTGVGVPTKLSWHKASFASSYRLEVGTDSTFAGGVVYLDSTLTDTSRTVAGLQYATRYFWRVKAKGAGGESGYSETWRFTSILAPPGIPLLRTPADGAGNLPATIVLAWSPVATATQYHVQVGTSAGFALPLAVNDSTVTDTTRSVSGLLPAVTYYWRVRAKGPGGAGAYAGARSFSTQPGAPGLIAPANLSTAEPLAVTFRWHPAPGATGYRLQVATDSLFATGIIKNDTTITDTFKLVAGLTINTRYYWRVSARDAEGYGPFSAGWSFLTFTPLPNQVTLLLPAEGVQIAADTARLVWSRSQPLVQRYWMEIAGDSLFQFKSVDSMLTDTSTVRRQLVRNQSYFWRVRAQNPGGWGPFSAVYGFRTLVTGVTDRKGLPTIYALDQNYPNPFNPATVIEFAVPREGRVRLEVYNLLGQHVGTLLDEVRQAGYHSLTFDAHGLPSGVYLYRLTADGVSLLKKMMLVR